MTIDRTKIVKKYKGQWVAFKEDRKTVVATGKKAITALHKAKKEGCENPILFRVPDKSVSYIGLA